MLLYNHRKEFVGIDQATLRRIGYNTIAELKEDVVDFADLFENRPGFLHNFKNFSWIDFIIHSEQDNIKARIRCNGNIYQCGFHLDIFYLANAPEGEEKSFVITLIDMQNLGADEGSQPREMYEPESLEAASGIKPKPAISKSAPAKQPTPQAAPTRIEPQDTKPEPLTLVFESDPEPEPEIVPAVEMPKPKPAPTPAASKPVAAPVTTKIELSTPANYVYDPSIAADELGLPTDLIDEFVGDFIVQAKKFKPEIESAIASEDFDQVQILSHKLKGVAANLRIEDALEVLTTINGSKDVKILRDYTQLLYQIIDKLEHGDVAATSPATDTVQPQNDIDDDIYSFDLIDTPKETLSFPQEETPDLTFEEDAPLELTFDDKLSFNDMPQDDTETFVDEMIDVHEAPEDEIEEPSAAVEDLSVDVQAVKASIAKQLDIDQDTLQSYINDFVDHANGLKAALEEALKTDDVESVHSIAADLKGMSEALHLDTSSNYLSIMQATSDRSERIENAKKLFQFIREL